MVRPPFDPLVGIERVIVDGNNLLHALREGPGAAPPAALVGRLRAIVPGSIRIEILFDGPPEPGLGGTRIAHGVTVRHSGRLSADALAVRLVTEATGGHPDPSGRPAILVVTDDGNLARELRVRGAATIGASWLIRRLARPTLASVSAGRPRPPAPPMPGPEERDHDAVRPGWKPGRGATAKRGNPKRGRP
ncbi:MAG: NYN domain-containing protein [Candidatus Limnocylindrales bacterium]